MQLVAYGAQDIYLTGNPQITFFKVVYRRHTNFAMEAIEQVFSGTADFGRRVTATISRNGDLITRVYLVVELPVVVAPEGTLCAWTRNLGNILIRNVTLEIGGQQIDKQYGEWLVIWAELTLPAGQVAGYAEMIGNTSDLYAPSAVLPDTPNDDPAPPARVLYIPLQFFFNRNVGLALPLIALQYHEVKIDLEFRPLAQLLKVENAEGEVQPQLVPQVSMQSASLWVDYIYLDTDERRRFAQVSHEYLIEQLQYTGEETLSGTQEKIRLNFNHPCKELVWVVRLADAEAQCQWSNFTMGTVPSATNGTGAYVGSDTLVLAKLQLNGHDRFATRAARYFNLVQPYQHHTNIPNTGIYVYSFALKPEEHQPSGTCNMSRIDNATFQMTFDPNIFNGVGQPLGGRTANLLMFAVNYNVLRIMSGMGGLAYSN
jgi:hypothetical protein